MTDVFIVKRIEMLQEELELLKRTVLKTGNRKSVKIRGIWQGVDFSDEEIEEVKLSWLKD